MPQRHVVLASSSPYRRGQLAQLGLRFEAIAPDIDETPREGEVPAALVRRLAREKAAAIQPHRPTALIIGSDQLAVCAGRVYGKPGNAERAFTQLRAAAGRRVDFLTALCVRDAARGLERLDLAVTRVRLRPLSDGEIRRYVAADRPFDCAGSLRSESLGPALCESIESDDPTALLGLPLIRLCAALRSLGVTLPA